MDSQLADRIIADALARAVPTPTPREVALPSLPGKADAVIGMRRSGKTWLLFQDMQARLAEGRPRESLLYMNFEDERLVGLEATDLGDLLDALYRRHPALRERGAFFYWDEVQNVTGWERFVRRLLDEEHGRVVVTGSSAKLLSRELATSLRGRSLPTELLPFSFAEALVHAGQAVPSPWPPPDRQRYVLRHAFDAYLLAGGFPEVQSLDERLRVRVLQDYVDAVLFRDIVERHGVSNVTALRYLVRRLLSAPAGRFSVHRFHNDVRSQGLQVGKDTLHDYLGHLEDAYLVFAVPIDSESERVRASNPRKIYPIDPALARAHSYRAADNVGHLLETVVYLQLRRLGFQAHYLTTRAGGEVDFVARRATDSAPRLVQVCASMADPATRARELVALRDAMQERRVQQGEIVTLDEAETLTVAEGEIRLVPAWAWLLHDAAVA